MNDRAKQTQLVELSDRSMPGRERTNVGDWVCRAADGVTGRANSCSALGDPGMPLARAVAEVERWFSRRSLRPLFQIWDGCDSDLVRVLDERGYERGEGAVVLRRDLAVGDWPDPSAEVTVIESPYGALDHLDRTGRIAELEMSPLPKLTAVIVDPLSDDVSSCGVGVIDATALGVFAMRTRDDRQRRGQASSILAAVLAGGAARGADVAWLQVMPSNTGARQLYERFHFEASHRYHYRAAPVS